MIDLKSSRRRFMGLLAAAPLVSKAAADEAIASLSGIKPLSNYGIAGKVTTSVGQIPPNGPQNGYDPHVALDAYVRTFGLPRWQEEHYRALAWNVSALDPDIACKRSWSMSVKIATQRERNYERLIATIPEGARRSAGRKLLEKALGGYCPWY